MERPGEQALTPAGAAGMYRRFVAEWAMDALTLRRAGLDTPSVRAGLRPLDEGRRDRDGSGQVAARGALRAGVES